MRFQTKTLPAQAAATLIDYGDRLGFGPAPANMAIAAATTNRGTALGQNAHPELMSSAFGHCSEAVVTLRLCQSQALAAGSWAEIVVNSIREAVFTHLQGADHTLGRPVKSYSAAKLGGHTSVHQLASKAFQLCGSNDRRATSFGPRYHHFVLVGVARYVQGAIESDSAPYFAELVANSWITKASAVLEVSPTFILGTETRIRTLAPFSSYGASRTDMRSPRSSPRSSGRVPDE